MRPAGGRQFRVGWKVLVHLSKPQFSSSQNKDNSKPHSSYLMSDNVQGICFVNSEVVHKIYSLSWKYRLFCNFRLS